MHLNTVRAVGSYFIQKNSLSGAFMRRSNLDGLKKTLVPLSQCLEQLCDEKWWFELQANINMESILYYTNKGYAYMFSWYKC